MTVHTGGCHCGEIKLEFETEKPLTPRACQCSFCRKHDTRSVSDPMGSAKLTLGPETQHYRFASHAADYLVCGRCGIYVGAVAEIDGRTYATLNLNAFDDPQPGLAAEPVSYDGETAERKVQRRRQRWTSAEILQA